MTPHPRRRRRAADPARAPDEPARRGLRGRHCGDGRAGADAAAAVRPPDAVILDLVLPGRRGTEVCRELRAWSRRPIIVLSVVGDESEKVAALDAGADDYVTKPFGVDELLARLRAALRRAEPSAEPVLEIGELRIDLEAREVTRGGRARAADAARVRPARLLARNEGKLLTHKAILREVWGRRTPTSPTTSTSTSRSCGASSSPIPRGRAHPHRAGRRLPARRSLERFLRRRRRQP